MAKKLMMSKGLTVTKATIAMIINFVLTGITYWQTQNYELTTTVFVGILGAVLTLALRYAEVEVPTPTPVTVA